MHEFSLFEPSLIISKDARSPGPCAALTPATRNITGQPIVKSYRGRLRKTDHHGYSPEALLGGD
jgi:hypothetical protein